MKNIGIFLLPFLILVVAQVNGQTMADCKNLLEANLGKTMGEWSLPNLKGDTISFADFKGKVVLIDFWGAVCPHCLLVEPDLKEFASKYKDQGFELISIECAALSTEERVRTGVEKHKTHEHTLINGVTLGKEYNILAFPTLVLLDRSRKVVYQHMGSFPKKYWKKKMATEIEKALALSNE